MHALSMLRAHFETKIKSFRRCGSKTLRRHLGHECQRHCEVVSQTRELVSECLFFFSYSSPQCNFEIYESQFKIAKFKFRSKKSSSPSNRKKNETYEAKLRWELWEFGELLTPLMTCLEEQISVIQMMRFDWRETLIRYSPWSWTPCTVCIVRTICDELTSESSFLNRSKIESLYNFQFSNIPFLFSFSTMRYIVRSNSKSHHHTNDESTRGYWKLYIITDNRSCKLELGRQQAAEWMATSGCGCGKLL